MQGDASDCGEVFGPCFLIFLAEPFDAEFSISSLLVPTVIEGHKEAVGHSPSWRLTDHVMYENKRIFMMDKGTRGQLKQGSGTGKGKWEKTTA